MYFKIETGIPIPLAAPEISEEILEEDVIEDTTWKPYRIRGRKRCAQGACLPAVGECRACGDIFPCPSGNCGHFDCAEKGSKTKLPEFVNVIESPSPVASAECRKIQVPQERPEQD